MLARDADPAVVDQPRLTAGRWVGPDGSVVMEAALAQALGVGDRITVSDREFTVSGLAVSAAIAPFPAACLTGCELTAGKSEHDNGGLIWATRALSSPGHPLYYLMNLKLADPSAAAAFADQVRFDDPMKADSVLGADAWPDVQRRFARTTDTVLADLLVGSSLLGLLAVAGVAVLVGGRMADRTRRVGLLKAVGGTPRLVAMVLSAEYVVVALVAAGAGIGVGALLAPELTGGMAGLLGTSGAPPVTVAEAAVVVSETLAVAVVATFVPTVRAVRASTVQALAKTARAPKPRRADSAVHATAGAGAARPAALRPRRAVLAAASTAITVSGIVAVLTARLRVASQEFSGPDALADPLSERLGQTMLVITVVIGVLASINAVFIVWATVLDARRSSAVARALGANAGQVSASLV
ncbi:FtsX-like permease family protein [Kitasatospora sp. NPDC001261]|uniref:FtsX-like permease family protein n=1 Tax=Kitasatospora sp. NPDC001261 TaxID=3364012 RepID=UPI0036756A96